MEFVADSSTLIIMAKAEILSWTLEDHVFLIPQAVSDECQAKESFDAKAIAAQGEAGRNRLRPVGNPDAAARLRKDFKIHRGEAEALQSAIENRRPMAVDDYRTIKACKILGVRFATAIHFLIALRESGRLDLEGARIRLEMLARIGRYSDRIVQDAMKRLQGEGR